MCRVCAVWEDVVWCNEREVKIEIVQRILSCEIMKSKFNVSRIEWLGGGYALFCDKLLWQTIYINIFSVLMLLEFILS